MTKADASNSKRSSATGTARGRGTYTLKVCDICRRKKIKCDGTRPVCSGCMSSGREDECTWTKQAARQPRTEAHFEAMRKRADALREYANLLESMLEKCRREHGGISDNGQSYLQFRPLDADGMVLPDEMEVEEETSDGTDDPTQELCLPTQNLKLDGGGLYFHGNTAIFRFAQAEVPLPSISRFPAIAENSDTTYVLLVDGVDESHYNPDFDWSRHLPSVVPLDRREHDKVLDLLFKFFTSWCFRVVPALFLRDMYRALSVPRSQSSPKTPHYSPMLHNSLVALATAFSDDPRIRDFKSRQYFAKAAKDMMEEECQKPNLSAIHALSILASFHSTQGDQSLGYMYFGMSARMSQALGLNIDCSAWVQAGLISEHDRLDRNWAHWTTFGQDVCWSLYVGRDFCVPLPSDHKRIPVPFVDSEFDQMPWHYPSSNNAPQPNYLSKTFAASCKLLMIARRIMDVVNSLNSGNIRQVVNDELISDIDLQLNTWKSSLSPDVDITLKSRPTATPHRLMLHAAYWWLFVLLHRPFYHRKLRHSSDREIDHVKLCKRAAENILELAHTWRSLYTLRYPPLTFVQTIFSAGTVFLLSAVQATSGPRVAQKELANSMDKAKVCVGYLLEIGKSWQCATNIAGILKRLIAEQVRPLLERRTLDGKTVSTSQPNKARDSNMERPQTSSSAPGRSRKGPASSRTAKQTAVRGSGRKQRSLIFIDSPYTSNAPSAVRVDNGFLQLSPPVIQTSPSLSPFSTGTDTLSSPPPTASPPSSDLGTLLFPTASSPMSLSLPEVTYPPLHSDQSSNGVFQPDQYLQAGYDYSQPSLPYTGMELSGFLAMLGGQTIPDVPYMPPFSMADGTMSIGSIPTSVSETAMLMDQGAPVSDADLQFWNDYYGAEQIPSTVATTEAPSANSNGNPDEEYNTEMVIVELGQGRDEAWMRYFT